MVFFLFTTDTISQSHSGQGRFFKNTKDWLNKSAVTHFDQRGQQLAFFAYFL